MTTAGARRWVLISALVSAGIITAAAVRRGAPPEPWRFTGVAIVATVLGVLAEATPPIAAALAIGVALGTGYASVGAQGLDRARKAPKGFGGHGTPARVM